MSGGALAAARPDYGVDAPGVIRNLFLAAALGVLLWGSAAAGLWSGAVRLGPVRIVLASSGLWFAAGFAAMAIWMLWSSKVGKIQERERLLDAIAWTGKERVLDVGCGRGLMLIGAAKRLTDGDATGIDIWQAEDLSGNRPEAVLENARREGVADRVRTETADMRKIPFPDGAFDAVVSCSAIHNLYARDDRRQAIREIARVLRPGGRAVIDDIRHGREYARAFEECGCAVRSVGSGAAAALLAIVTFGSLRPATLVVEKGTATRAVPFDAARK